MMIMKDCKNCGRTCWHNPMKDKAAGFRCTYCAYPPGTGPKGERNTAIMRQQIAKPR